MLSLEVPVAISQGTLRTMAGTCLAPTWVESSDIVLSPVFPNSAELTMALDSLAKARRGGRRRSKAANNRVALSNVFQRLYTPMAGVPAEGILFS